MTLNEQAMHYIKYNIRDVNTKINFEIKTVDGIGGGVRIGRKGALSDTANRSKNL